MPERTYDAVIIGTGQGGKPLALALAKAGWKTAVVEREHVGGTCVNYGCTPTKTMVASARVAHLSRRGADYGVETGPISVRLSQVIARKRAIVESFRNGSQRGLEQTPNLDLLFGEARFSGPRRVEVALNVGGTTEITGRHVFINTGTRSARPPIPGLEDVPFLDNRSIMELDELPERLLVVGGGYIGLEFGQMFHRFGSSVAIVHRGERLLTREDADVAEAVAEILLEDGLEVLLRAQTKRIARNGGDLVLEVESPEGPRTLTGSHLLVATGRTPNTERLNLAAAGVKTDAAGYIQADERLRTSADGVYAIGDVKGGPAFTHISYDDYRILRANLLEGGDATTRGRMVPYTAFIDPQLGRVGLSEDEARAQGLRFRVAKIPMSYVARALEMDEARGFMKALVEEGSGRILGCAVLGVEGGELMAMLEIAMMGSLPFTALREGIFAHPTLAESLNTLFSSLDG